MVNQINFSLHQVQNSFWLNVEPKFVQAWIEWYIYRCIPYGLMYPFPATITEIYTKAHS